MTDAEPELAADTDEPATTTTAAEQESEPAQTGPPSLVVDPVTVSEGLNTFTLEGSGFDPGVMTWTLLCPLTSDVSEDTPEDELVAAMTSVAAADCDLSTSRKVTFDDEGSFTTERDAIVIGNFMWVASDSAETQVAAAAVFMDVAMSTADRALAFLAGELGVPASEITLTDTAPVTWPDGSLGCPKEGYAYTQAIEPGYRFTFSHGTASHDVHSNEEGTLFVRPVGCYDPSAAEPTPTTSTAPPTTTAPTTTAAPTTSTAPPTTTTTAPATATTTVPVLVDVTEATRAVMDAMFDLFERAFVLWDSGDAEQACVLVDEARAAANSHLETFGSAIALLSTDTEWNLYMETLDEWEAACADSESEQPDQGSGSTVWTPPQAGTVPVVHPDTPPTSWERGDFEPGVHPFETPRTTGPDRVPVAEWINWMGGTDRSYTQWLMRNMKWALDYLGASPNCVITQYYDRVVTSNEVTPPNQAEPGYLRDLYGWSGCVTVIDPFIPGVALPEDRNNDIGLRLSDTPGITLADRCRAVLPEDIQLEGFRFLHDANGNRVGEPGYYPYEPGHAGCDEWAMRVESDYWFVNGDYPACFRSSALAVEWMEHHYGKPDNYSVTC